MPANENERPGERELVAQLLRLGLVDAGGPIPFGDDMAAAEPGAAPLLWSSDMLMDGVDFDSSVHDWRSIGRKAMAVSLSDCAAMAAAPLAALCAIALEQRLPMRAALDLQAGVAEAARAAGCRVVGGDTNSWPQPSVICVTVSARPEPGRAPVTRRGARPGAALYLTGKLGGSILGRHMRPPLRIDVALAMNRELGPLAMIDISDGLAIDLSRMLEASGCGAELEAPLLEDVIHDDARTLARQTGRPPLAHALHDGEDFELLAALPAPLPKALAERFGLALIGRVVEGAEMTLVARDGQRRPIEPRGWEHPVG
jgi:thiamine-monophosphate kinase